MKLTDEEFEDLTPGMFRALMQRRNVRIKYERFAAAQTAAAVYNVSRNSEEIPVLTAMDFVREKEAADELERVREMRRDIRQAFGSLPRGIGRKKILEMRAKLIETLRSQGNADAEAIFDDCWPSLKPKENEL